MALNYFSINIINYYCSKIDNLNSIINQNIEVIKEQERQIANLQQEVGAENTSVMGMNSMKTSQVDNIDVFFFCNISNNKYRSKFQVSIF